jgi:hypothetical protein
MSDEQNEVDIQTSEFGYYLISELITMPDRILAQKLELAIWNRCPIPNEPILCKIIELLKESEDNTDFYKSVQDYIDKLPIKWVISPSGSVIRD